MRTSLMARVLVVAFFAFGLLANASHAQSTNAAVGGQITDEQGRVVPGVTVVLTNLNTGVPYEAKTNGDGLYNAPVLPPGIYRANVTKDGFKSIVKGDIELHVQDQASINFQLQIGSVNETVTVEAGGLVINTTDAAVSTVIDHEFIDKIPLNGRTLQNLLYLTPGVVPTGTIQDSPSSGFSVNGVRDQVGGNWMVDGVSANLGTAQAGANADQFTPALSSLGTTQPMVSLDSLQEFRLNTSSYGPEFGNAPGAQISFSTRPGTNQFHGSAFDYIRNSAFDANNWFADQASIPNPGGRQNDFGGTIGGPVVLPSVYDGHNETFFFFSIEALRLAQPAIINGVAFPTASFRSATSPGMQQVLNAFPMPNGAPIGNTGWALFSSGVSNPSNLNAASLRLDHSFSSEIRGFYRISYAPSTSTTQFAAIATQGNNISTSSTLGLTFTPFPSVSDDLRLNYSKSINWLLVTVPKFGGNDPSGLLNALLPTQYVVPSQGHAGTFLVVDPSLPTLAQLSVQRQAATQNQWEMGDTLVFSRGKHSWKGGFDWTRHAPVQQPISYRSTYEFFSIAGVQSSTVDFGQVGSTLASVNPIFTRFSTYFGDTWRITSRLTINYGLRWELPLPPYFQGGNPPVSVGSIKDPSNLRVTQNRTQWDTTWDNLAPRIGLAYRLRATADSETVVRVGGGLFYSADFGSATSGAVSYPNAGTNRFFGQPFPVDAALLKPPQFATLTPPYGSINGFDQHLQLPQIWQWNMTVEQALGRNQSVTVSYVGSAGRKLFLTSTYNLNCSFCSPPIKINPNFTSLEFEYNGAISNYDALQVKFDRHMFRGLQVLASYTWAHSTDDASFDLSLFQPAPGNSDFDVRNAVTTALLYRIPSAKSSLLRTITSAWEFSNSFSARSGLPLNVAFRSSFNADGTQVIVRPDVVPGQPFYLYSSAYPGGTAVNLSAFAKPTGKEGNLGRNVIRNQGMWQLDSSLQRAFPFPEPWGQLLFRVDAFNIFNHPNFGPYFFVPGFNFPGNGQPLQTLNSYGGGLTPLYAQGGPRSLQLSLRYQF